MGSAIQTLHRARDRLVGKRTALINQLRAVLLERGITVAQSGPVAEQSAQTRRAACASSGETLPPLGL
jgi:transposase